MEQTNLRRRRTNSTEKKLRDDNKRLSAARKSKSVLYFIVSLVIAFLLLYTFPKHPLSRSVILNLEDRLHQLELLERRHAVVIDAGSTGSRVLAFSFHRSLFTNDLVLKDELWHQVKPGLSSYADDPLEGGNTIVQLINKAKGRIPEKYWSSTPIALKATAGLRLLPSEKAENLLTSVRSVIKNSGFHDGHGDPVVEIMSDLNEGIFGWVTVNFLLNKLGDPVESAVALDLGGGSTQISFIPSSGSTLQETPDGFLHLREVQGTETNFYTHSYLGLGLMSARKAIIQVSKHTSGEFASPCFTSSVDWSHQGESMKITPHHSKGFHHCKLVVDTIIDGKSLHTPAELGNRNIVAFSYFFDRAVEADILSVTGGDLLVLHYKQAAEKACADPEASFQCIDLTFIYSLLTKYGLKDSSYIGVYKQIDGHETSWALGAALDLLTK